MRSVDLNREVANRANWLSWLVSTEPADRKHAESSLAEMYAAAGMTPPSHFFWFDSPFMAAWAAGLLKAPHDFIWQRLLEAVARNKRERYFIERIRAELCEKAGVTNWESLLATAGGPLDSPVMAFNRAPRPAKSLQGSLSIARVGLYENVADATRFYDDKDDLHRSETHLRRVLSGQAEWSTINPELSAYSRYYSFSWMAMDEAAADGRAAPPILAAAWNLARSAGPWWSFSQSVVLSDRPAEMHLNEKWLLHRGDGPAALYRDDSRLWAWNGHAMREEWILHPENISARDLKEFDVSFREYVATRVGSPKAVAKPKYSSILKKELPRLPEERAAFLRKHNDGRLPLFDRYVAGEHEKVWNELVTLGPAVREDPHAADALAVAYETMRRVEANVRTITERLQTIGYKGAHEQMHEAPGRKAYKEIERLEKKAGTLPLSLRAFYEVVGAVDWIGQHPSLAPENDVVAPDPLVIFPLEDALQQCKAGFVEDQAAIAVAPDDLHKANTSGGEPYEIAVPELGADGKLLNERHDLYFVEYLRLVFRFGGFPGYDGIDPVPEQLAQLRQGLIPF
jgi:hypothetical protein